MCDCYSQVHDQSVTCARSWVGSTASRMPLYSHPSIHVGGILASILLFLQPRFLLATTLLIFQVLQALPNKDDGLSSVHKGFTILLDVDNTLYPEGDHGIEHQIVQNIHSYCLEEHNMTRQHADDLHFQYGSTIEGLRQTIWKHHTPAQLQESMRHFYDRVYSTVRVDSLLGGSGRTTTSCTQPSTIDKKGDEHDDATARISTGYTHILDQDLSSQKHTQQRKQEWIRRFWKSCPYAIHLASNSPTHHVQKVIQAMGLCRLLESSMTSSISPPKGQLFTPDHGRAKVKPKWWWRWRWWRWSRGENNDAIYPTKRHPATFFGSLVADNINDDNLHNNYDNLVLVDDSPRALEACAPFMRGVHVDHQDEKQTLETVLGRTMGWFQSNYTFSQVDYLVAKNRVDAVALNRETWFRMGAEVKKLLLQNSSDTRTVLQIVDVGAGLLSMLRWMLEGSQQVKSPDLPSLLEMLGESGNSSSASPESKITEIHYFAYEPNEALREACLAQLNEMGFLKTDELLKTNSLEQNFEKRIVSGDTTKYQEYRVFVHLRCWNYQYTLNGDKSQPTPHLIVGCCFADLLEPQELVSSLMRSFLVPSTAIPFNRTILYFPITFRGITQFLPPQPFEESPEHKYRMVPSDTTVFSRYAEVLSKQHGHNIHPELLEEALGDFGAKELSWGRSDWVIDPKKHCYLWETMLYFFGNVIGLELQEQGLDAREWFRRARRNRPTIQVSNIDMLWQIPHIGSWEVPDNTAHLAPKKTYDEIQFVSPEKVTTIEKVSPDLKSDQVRIQSVASLISSGTELKIFQGTFDDAALDVNIKGMEDERMAYPLAYGYSLVGRVVESGRNAEDLIGKLVFVFSAHASQVIADCSSVHVIPDGIDPYDAIFLPSVETALALVHDANPRFGEQVAVFGQGLIGLLVTAVLRKQSLGCASGRFGTITTVDTIAERLAASAAMGASQALFPSEITKAGPFDVAIEISGNGRALQSAIDTTVDGGRIIVGSWYGNADVALRLGIDFHRSHKELKASQVSELPADMSRTWSKSRRFEFTWDLVREIRPSRLITRKTPLDHCQEVYEALAVGNEIAVAFDYCNI